MAFDNTDSTTKEISPIAICVCGHYYKYHERNGTTKCQWIGESDDACGCLTFRLMAPPAPDPNEKLAAQVAEMLELIGNREDDTHFRVIFVAAMRDYQFKMQRQLDSLPTYDSSMPDFELCFEKMLHRYIRAQDVFDRSWASDELPDSPDAPPKKGDLN